MTCFFEKKGKKKRQINRENEQWAKVASLKGKKKPWLTRPELDKPQLFQDSIAIVTIAHTFPPSPVPYPRDIPHFHLHRIPTAPFENIPSIRPSRFQSLKPKVRVIKQVVSNQRARARPRSPTFIVKYIYARVQGKKRRERKKEYRKPKCRTMKCGRQKRKRKAKQETMRRAKKQMQTKHNLHWMHAVLSFPTPMQTQTQHSFFLRPPTCSDECAETRSRWHF